MLPRFQPLCNLFHPSRHRFQSLPRLCLVVANGFRQVRTYSNRQTEMEETFEVACSSRDIPGAVLIAADKSGKFTYSRAFGVRSLQDSSENKPLTVDSTMWIASCTKLLTSIAAMQCVERGLITLDEDIRPVIHEFNDLDILMGIDESTGVLKCAKNTVPITLRQLLTHTSGLAYESNEPLLQLWRKQQPENQRLPPTSVTGRFLHPLVHEPGIGWSYGPSTDWAGVLIERITNSKTLQDYMIRHIWEPLSITDMTFFPSTRPDLLARMTYMSLRNSSNSDNPAATLAAVYSKEQPILGPDMDDAQGGTGIFASVVEYIKVLRALLLASDASASDLMHVPPAQLLRRSTVQAMFTPQLGESSRASLQAISAVPLLNNMMGGVPTATRKDFGLGGLLVLDDLKNWRQKGTMTWGGRPNLTWWIDPTAELCGLYASQIMPIGDAKSVEMVHIFEKAMYERKLAATNGQKP